MKLKNWNIKINFSAATYLVLAICACLGFLRFTYSTDLYDKVDAGIYSVMAVVIMQWIQEDAKITIEKCERGEDDTKLEG